MCVEAQIKKNQPELGIGGLSMVSNDFFARTFQL